MDTCFPFGLRSAPKIFTAVADAVEWIVKQKGVHDVIHYLDDYLLVSDPCMHKGRTLLDNLLSTLDVLRLPVAPEKLEGPTTKLTFLGIELDTVTMVRRLPPDKLADVKQTVATWLRRKDWRSCDKHALESLVRKLQHASKVVRPGRTFVGRLIGLLKGIPRQHKSIRLNVEYQSDLLWWFCFLERWNGVAMMEVPGACNHHVFSDASGSFGCGAWWDGYWFQLQWPENCMLGSIAAKELLPMVVACAIWGRHWRNQRVLAHCDNEAAVQVVNSSYSSDPEMMQLLRSLFFITAWHGVSFRAIHLPGRNNTQADAISRNNMDLFFRQVPNAARLPSAIPVSLLDLLIGQRPDWTSPTWSQLFISSSQLV